MKKDILRSSRPGFTMMTKNLTIYTATQKTTKKVHNILRNPDKIYFSIDDANYPYKGVKGRAVARISEDIQKNLPIVEKINMKYLDTIEHPLCQDDNGKY
jgi:general stress protein 26